jgi:hypothetical protein
MEDDQMTVVVSAYTLKIVLFRKGGLILHAPAHIRNGIRNILLNYNSPSIFAITLLSGLVYFHNSVYRGYS